MAALESHRPTKAQADQSDIAREMTLEGMRGLGFEACCDIFAEHVSGRPDAAPSALEQLGNRIARIGHMRGRE